VNKDDVTIVVVPRDHFSDSRESLESVFQFTRPMCPLVYVDGGSPAGVARYLRERASAHRFELIRHDRYPTPNQARNIGAARVQTRYIVFIDNAVVVAPDWGSRRSWSAATRPAQPSWVRSTSNAARFTRSSILPAATRKSS
jgi:hypothetical protein